MISVISIPVLAFIGSFFGGEHIILILSMLSGQGYFGFWLIYLFFIAGTVCSDIVWFLIGKSLIIEHLKKIKRLGFLVGIKRKIDKRIKKEFKSVLVTSKFIYGTRILSLIYLGRRRMKWKEFLMCDILITAILILIVSSVGWLAGRGIIKIFGEFKQLKILIAVLLISFLAISLILGKLMSYFGAVLKKWLK